ncbi:MAG: hypothetical protein R6V04_04890 [bacterium]
MNNKNNIFLESYKLAWRSFKKWWIPICIVSLFIFVFEIIPRILVSSEFQSFNTTATQLTSAIIQNDTEQIKLLSITIQYKIRIILNRIMQTTAIVFPFIALATVILLMIANWATKDKKGKGKSVLSLIYIACVHILLACIKFFAFLLFIIPGVYIYVKLLFVSLVMLEEDLNAWEAVKKSWNMTHGYFVSLFLLVALNSIIQCILLFTIIGIIPGTGYVNTVRASAFRLILQKNK